MGKEPEVVRCVECRHEYELPPIGEEMGCPDCGCISWVSARIPWTPVKRAGYSGVRADRA